MHLFWLGRIPACASPYAQSRLQMHFVTEIQQGPLPIACLTSPSVLISRWLIGRPAVAASCLVTLAHCLTAPRLGSCRVMPWILLPRDGPPKLLEMVSRDAKKVRRISATASGPSMQPIRNISQLQACSEVPCVHAYFSSRCWLLRTRSLFGARSHLIPIFKHHGRADLVDSSSNS
jgi:hypothetical protein